MRLFTRAWALDALERAIKAFVGAVMVGFGPGAVADVNVYGTDWRGVLIRGGWAAAASLMLSVASSRAQGISPASVVPPGV